MKIADLPLAEAKLLLNTPTSGKDLVYLTISELIGLQAIALEKEKSFVVVKAKRFDYFNHESYAIFYRSVDEYYKRLNDPDKLREPLLTPYRLVEKVYNKSDKNFENYKKLIAKGLQSKKLMKPNRWFWRKYDLTQTGQLVKDRIVEQLSSFEIEFQEWKSSRQKRHANKLKEIILEFGSLIMLSDHVNKNSLQELKAAIDQTLPTTVDYQTEMILDAVWCVDVDWPSTDFDIFDVFN